MILQRPSRRSLAAIGLLCAAMLFCAACSRKKRAPRPPAAPAPGWTETGIASWYGHPYHGRRAANGEVYDMNQLTAAHRTLPFGALVSVTNLTNRKTVTVRITDRGPFVDGRIIDLSRAAAGQISMLGPGTAPVEIQLLGYASLAPASSDAVFVIQAGAFADRDNADKMRARLLTRVAPVEVISSPGSAIHRVLAGRFPTFDEAEAAASLLRREIEGVFVIRLQ